MRSGQVHALGNCKGELNALLIVVSCLVCRRCVSRFICSHLELTQVHVRAEAAVKVWQCCHCCYIIVSFAPRGSGLARSDTLREAQKHCSHAGIYAPVPSQNACLFQIGTKSPARGVSGERARPVARAESSAAAAQTEAVCVARLP